MTFFTSCLDTWFTLPRRAKRARECKTDGMEDDGRSRAASAFCGGGVPAREAFGGFVRGVRRLPSDWIPMAGTLSRPRGGRHCRAQPQTPPQSRADGLRARTAGCPDASAVSRLGGAQASGPARSRRPCADSQHHPPHPAALRSGARPGPPQPGHAALRALCSQRTLADGLQGAQPLAAAGGAAVGARRP